MTVPRLDGGIAVFGDVGGVVTVSDDGSGAGIIDGGARVVAVGVRGFALLQFAILTSFCFAFW